ncbi:acetylcholinesterase precursor [Cryphonectria parasitica EP155]|uniref:Carboxylic ester hydrolase n=1 Tax=Cryphonectria parasitica (strain ATCC 38755 / EP155) TaxID=660469 RepID=A0A9P4Y055_CRYP1|nr:acetylcholinesterase precursor [Cryphonectria parasitica EP155]KAF3763960.1 acetylcholinesterase precursor [Cryphonectria parasitica EP155]
MTFAGLVQAAPYPNSSYSNADTSLTFVYQNNLNASDDVNHVGAILLDPASQDVGAARCAALGESLLAISTLDTHTDDFEHALSYLAYAGLVDDSQKYYVQDGVLSVTYSSGGSPGFSTKKADNETRPLPILCTQSSSQNEPTTAVATVSNELRISSAGNTYVGFRNQKSFRFLGIPYANPFERFAYSTVYNATGQTINATEYGADCAQAGSTGSQEDCLFLNIQTPYIPQAGSTDNLRPVLFSIHGGGFTSGNGGASSGLDGGNLASREDIVSVELNYRLSTLGFLAIPGTDVKGNFGIGDQVTALEWVKQNIASFGGNPNKVTIIGESAGAGSVRTLLGSPPVIENTLISGGVSQSNLGGGKALGLDGDYATTYSSYYTIEQSYEIAGQQIIEAVGCNETDIEDQIACLKAVNATTIVNLSTVARYVVQDGTYVNTEQLIVTEKNGSQAFVPIIFGTTNNDGASFCNFPLNTTTSEAEGIAYSLDISQDQAQRVIDSGLFPYYDSGNLTLDTFNVSQRVSTDLQFRCIDEATVFAAATSGAVPVAYYYNIDRTYEGYDPLGLGPSLNGGTDPEGNYFRLHGSDLGFTYGNQDPLRDERDLQASQLISGYYAAFAKTGSPNPDEAYLNVRGYTSTLEAVRQTGTWDPVSGNTGPAKNLDYPSLTIDFPETRQCSFLNYSLSYYLDGGS